MWANKSRFWVVLLARKRACISARHDLICPCEQALKMRNDGISFGQGPSFWEDEEQSWPLSNIIRTYVDLRSPLQIIFECPQDEEEEIRHAKLLETVPKEAILCHMRVMDWTLYFYQRKGMEQFISKTHNSWNQAKCEDCVMLMHEQRRQVADSVMIQKASSSFPQKPCETVRQIEASANQCKPFYMWVLPIP